MSWFRITLLLTALAAPFTGFAIEHSGVARFADCYAQWNDSELTVGNDSFERRWTIQNGRLEPVSFRLKNPDFDWVTSASSGRKLSDGLLTITADHGHFGPVEAESLKLNLAVASKTPQQLEMKIFPGFAGVAITSKNQEHVHQPIASAQASGVEQNQTTVSSSDATGGLENLSLAPLHLVLTQVTLTDQTDIHNELVSEKEWLLAPNEASFGFSGNAAVLEDTLTGYGLVFLRLAPSHHPGSGEETVDFFVNPRTRKISLGSQDFPVAIVAYRNGRTGRIATLQQFQRKLRAPDLSRDGVFLSNTWGDRSRDARINEEFILKEIAAGQRVGVDVIQLDDGWQKGRSKNSARQGGVWGGWWAADSNFWDPNSIRFPHGLKPVVEAAQTKGMKIGLWFSPDSSRNAVNWQRDADCVLRFYNQLGIQYFKIDGLDTEHPQAAENERRMFDYVLQASSGKVVFDLDVTAGNRPGYFGLPEIGPIFVENRYTDWHNYWPHLTLRNLWKLSQYVDPLRLRIELLNNLRNATNYENDPLSPARYRFDTLFAMTMPANPLGWFEVSNLSSNQISEIAPLVTLWKQHRSRFYDGSIIPIGNAPDGIAWTGFASVSSDHATGHLLLFRELNDDVNFSFNLKPLFSGAASATILAGRGNVSQHGNQLHVTIPAKLDYVWIQVTPVAINTGSASQSDKKSTL